MCNHACGRIRSLEVDLRTALQEAELLANKAARAAAARDAKSAAAANDVAAARAELKGQLAAKDGQVNGLVQELAATQSQLSDSQTQLQEVGPSYSLATGLRSRTHLDLLCQRRTPRLSSTAVYPTCESME